MTKPEFLIYRSSAGSGKTQALAGEYLQLILSNRADFRNVLAITFTNKAAEEMKERVLELLEYFSREPESKGFRRELFDHICEIAGVSHLEMQHRAQEIRSDILHHYSDFHVGTIDSFVHRIIRSFALELNLSFAFEVQLETQQFLQMTVDDLLEHTGEDKELTNNLVRFTRSLLEDEKSWNIDKALIDFSRFLTAEESIIPMEKLANAGIDLQRVIFTNRQSMKRISDQWDQLLQQGADIEIRSGVNPENISHGLKGGIARFFERGLREQRYEVIYQRADSAKRMVACMDGDAPMYPKKALEAVKESIDALQHELRKVWQPLTEAVDKFFPEYVSRQLIDQNISQLALSKKIRDQMQITMDRENLIPIYEFNRLIWSIIRNQPVPFIYERTSERFDHFLIDEFQDTSSLQWYNLLPLVENALSQGGLSMVVGDAKQAIYRWRNGDVWQFVRLPSLKEADGSPMMQMREEALKRYAQEKELKANYRSTKEVIDFNNRFFGWLTNRYPDDLGEIYRGHDQLVGEGSEDGQVEFFMIPFDKEDRAADYDRKMAEATVSRVMWLLSEKGGNYHLSDICILVRKHEQASILAEALMKAGVEVVSGESFKLNTFSEAVVVRAIAGLLQSRTDGVSASVLATHLLHAGRINEQTFHLFLSDIKNSIDKHGTLYPLIDSLLEESGLSTAFSDYRRLPLYDVCEEVIRSFFGSRAAAPAAQYLLDITASFIRSSGNDMTAYVSLLDEKLNTSVPLPDTGQAVQIMTVHKSKGLQFPVVLYAFASEEPVSKMDYNKHLWIDTDAESAYESLPVLLLPYSPKLANTPFSAAWERETAALFQDMVNVVYVAFTRAKERLLVISSAKGRRANSERHLYHLFSEYLQQDPQFVSNDDVIWQYGNPLNPIHSTTSTHNQEILRMPAWASFGWHDRIGVQTGYLRALDDVERTAALTRGNLLHALLAEIDAPEQIPALVHARTLNGWIDPEDANEITETLSSVIGLHEVKHLYDQAKTRKREAAIITPEGKTLRPDRVVMLEDMVAVIDFKTGNEHPSHKRQVKLYCDTLLQMGHPVVKGYLLYIDKLLLVNV